MPPLGECSHRIDAAVAMVDDFCRKHKTLTKGAAICHRSEIIY
jgi:hypothetical protein